MLDSQNAFVTPTFLRSVWNLEYEAFKGSPAEKTLFARLQRWSARKDLGETSAEPAFIEQFFQNTWGYVQPGQPGDDTGFTLRPQFPVKGAGAGGGTGRADLGMGYFTDLNGVPQVLCEYKSIKSRLDAEQKRKGNTRSPVRQALDYLSHARKGMVGSEPQLPTWALVSDMNEFRLYWYDRGEHQHVGFFIKARTLFDGPSLLGDTEASRFDRFLFSKLFHSDTLLTRGGRSLLLNLISERRFRDRKIEEGFYTEYRTFRDRLYNELLVRNGEATPRFPGTKGRLVRLAQKVLDRLIFIFFCEDMGQQLAFPPKLLQEFLVNRANDAFYDTKGTTIWQDLLRLFRAMDDGSAFGGKVIHKFNGGLFSPDPALEALEVPNGLFCQQNQGQNEASIASHPQTVLYFCATYNFAADLGEGGARQGQKSLGLYMLGRIFEQSITELEILEAKADGRTSVNSKRKMDGVYYTPERIVELVVDGVLEPAFDKMRQASGWADGGEELPTVEVLDSYLGRLSRFAVLDPACGSGAFLITALRHMVNEWKRTRAVRAQVAGQQANEEADADLVARLLQDSIYGIDINPASVEITQLALWLHTARADKPLSSLERTIRCGNTLVTNDFYRGEQLGLYDTEKRELINAFDWKLSFPAIAAREGFDAIVGNPPYVKLQNFRDAYPEVANYLIKGRPGVVAPPFRSTVTGNFDLYLPFIEKGIEMLNPNGILGYIAPSLWIMSDNGVGLRNLVGGDSLLDRWLDFRSYQVFEEATTYTALQFFTKMPSATMRIAHAPSGHVPPKVWTEVGQQLAWGDQVYGDRWLLLAGPERALIKRLSGVCKRLDDPAITSQIHTGLQTSADDIYFLKYIRPGHYLCSPKTPKGDPKLPSYEVELEDDLMRPLMSGPDAKRYQEPNTDTWILCPYTFTNNKVELITADKMERDYPLAWKYLLSYKTFLENREIKKDTDGKIIYPFRNERWYRLRRQKKLEKIITPKLVVASTVPSMRVCFDHAGRFALNNVRVNGIDAAKGINPWFLLGVLNTPIIDWIFRRIAKPKDGDWFEANKQFIAPLPIPNATPKERATVAKHAQELQRLHTLRQTVLSRIERRLGRVRRCAKDESWLFTDVPSPSDREKDAPLSLDTRQRHDWAKNIFEVDLTARLSALSVFVKQGKTLDANLSEDGELSFIVDGQTVIDKVFVGTKERKFLLAQWKVIASTFVIAEKSNGKRLSQALRTVAASDNEALVEQVVTLVDELQLCETSIRDEENKIDDLVSSLFRLRAADKALIKAT